MFGLYTPVFVLQAFCVYHAYRNHAEQRWYWLIVFFPLVGSLIYLVQNFNNRATINSITEGVKGVVNSNYKIGELEKALKFSDNVTNKINLADAYFEIGRYKDAIELYQGCLLGFMAEDVTLQMKLLHAHFHNGDFAEAIHLGKSLEHDKAFKDSAERVAYAWSLCCTGDSAAAEKIFESMDKSFSNYYQRLQYCHYLLKANRKEEAKEKLAVMLEEATHMKTLERKQERANLKEIKNLYDNMIRS
jgi:hypothetical protein